MPTTPVPPAPDISVVIPVYRSAEMLPKLVERLCAVLDGLGRPYEMIMVDDSSPDDSWRVLNELQRARPERLVLIQLMRNFGQHNALMCGFRHARGRLLITMDDDLQNPPEEIPRLLEAIESTGSDLVYGVPDEKQHPALRNAGSALICRFYQVVFKMRVRPTSYRIIRRELVAAILTYSLNFTFIDGLLAWNTQRISQITVAHYPRPAGRSGYSLGKLLVLALNLFTNYSLLPLQAVSLVGFAAAAGGFLVGAYYLAAYFFSAITVPGYASTITAILILGGVQLLAIGVMGEYLGRLHLNVNRKPQYTIRSVTDSLSVVRSQGVPLEEVHGFDESGP
jgi:undecaprenyl-phosphate 4-deoxy-4-formamido-L-arabinose transferase